jgi:hypothetical protein
MAFFNLGVQELIILAIPVIVGGGVLIAVCISMAGRSKKDED